MINSVVVTNHLGESIAIELRFPEKSGFLIRDGGITGLGPPKANINVTEIITRDGALYNSAHVNSRNIVFYIGFLEKPTIEATRQRSYKYFPVNRRVNLRFESDSRVCLTYGYVESNEPDIFSKNTGCVISIVCPDSYLYSPDKDITFFSISQPLFEFPFSNESLADPLLEFGSIEFNTEKSVWYSGDAPIGMVMYIHSVGPAINPVITNTLTGETIKIDTTKLAALTGDGIINGDTLIISTVKGNKRVFLQREGVIYNVLNALGRNISWFQLEKGDNRFSYSADDGAENLQFRIESQVAYEGI